MPVCLHTYACIGPEVDIQCLFSPPFFGGGGGGCRWASDPMRVELQMLRNSHVGIKCGSSGKIAST